MPILTITSSSKQLLVSATIAALLFAAAWQQTVNKEFRIEVEALRLQVQALQRQDTVRQAAMENLLKETQVTKEQTREVARLRSEVTGLRQEAVRFKVSGQSPSNAPPSQPSEADVTSFLHRAVAEQGQVLGAFRYRAMNHQFGSPEEFAYTGAMAVKVRPQLESLESRPADFAAFQTSFVQNALNLQDKAKLSQIREIIEKTYEQAVATGLDAPSRPETGVEDWAKRRDQLDRSATRLVQSILSPEERAAFDTAFLGIMGIDLGLNDGGWHRFVTEDGTIVFPSEGPSK